MTRLALLSVSNKTGLVELAQTLVTEFNFDIISSGGTAKVLKEASIPVTKVSDYTASPEILGGRVKTLHPRIHGGILARRDVSQDITDLTDNQIRPIDLVVVNLYPFEETIAKPDVTTAEAIEQIDIGGPAMLRAASKNFAHLTVLCNPLQYDSYLEELRNQGGEASVSFRQKCALQGFLHTCEYDKAISNYLMKQSIDETSNSEKFEISGTQLQTLRYGENPHQSATWYQTGAKASGWAAAQKLQGKELSYNNLVDLEAARRIIAEFPDSEPAAAVLKHTNPCGVAISSTLQQAYTQSFNADSMSAFGGIVALNKPIDKDTATELTKTFLECVVAPSCEPEAAEILSKKSKLRILTLGDLNSGQKSTIKAIAGGLLVQAADDKPVNTKEWTFVTDRKPTESELAELVFAWKVCKHVKSNAIVISRDRTTLGIGAGQMNRVGAAKIALEQAADKSKGAFLASDGFFPFDDSVRTAAEYGITAIVQPGGSLRDEDSIKAANELGLAMVFTGVRHFLH
ncbi:MAG: bifunctional phosphoribosylaminoimidazolecarboxamide formyltransferase/IMP cyclohydrolase [Cyanobacteria bacterium P01_A01_bin.45]